MTYAFFWKLIDGDKFLMEFSGYETLQDAIAAHFDFWGVTPADCSEFAVVTGEKAIADFTEAFAKPYGEM